MTLLGAFALGLLVGTILTIFVISLCMAAARGNVPESERGILE